MCVPIKGSCLRKTNGVNYESLTVESGGGGGF